MTPNERQTIIDQFTSGSALMVLVIAYAVAAIHLKLQYDCWRVHCLEMHHNIGITAQAVGRARRLSNLPKSVYLYEYTVPNIF